MKSKKDKQMERVIPGGGLPGMPATFTDPAIVGPLIGVALGYFTNTVNEYIAQFRPEMLTAQTMNLVVIPGAYAIALAWWQNADWRFGLLGAASVIVGQRLKIIIGEGGFFKTA